MSTNETSSSTNKGRRRRRRSGGQSKNSGGNTSQSKGQSRGRGGRNRSRGGGQSTRRRNADRGSGGVYRINRTERPTPALWRRILQTITFGLFKADPYFIPGSERFQKPQEPVTEAPTRGKSEPKAKKTARKRTRRTPSGEGEGQTGQTAQEKKAPEIVEATTPRLYVGNLSYDVTESDLATLFGQAGGVEGAEIVTHGRSGRSKGYAFVTMNSVDEAKAAVKQLHDHELLSRKMVVSGAKSPGRKKTEDAPAAAPVEPEAPAAEPAESEEAAESTESS